MYDVARKMNKKLTFSYDDGVIQDIRLIELLNKYGMKGTFNLNSELFSQAYDLHVGDKMISHHKVDACDVKHIYQGHEVAVHTLTHPNLKDVVDDKEVIRQVEEDRLKLSSLCGYEVEGMAYPCGGACFNDRVIDLIKNNTGVKYARTTDSTYNFERPDRLLALNPSVYHLETDKMFELGEKFIDLKTDREQIFYVWGHSYEFEMYGFWDKFEEFLKMMSGRPDIEYCTNRECILK